MPISYKKLFEKMEQQSIKKINLRQQYHIHPATIQKLVNNQSVTVDTLCILCDVLNCNIGDIVDYIPKQNTKQM